MGIYRHYRIIILSILILGSTGCSTNRRLEQVAESARNESSILLNTAITGTSINSETSPTTELNTYNSIIEQYINVKENDYYKDISLSESDRWGVIGPNLNLNLVYYLGTSENFEMYYALYDIDKNGIPELILGGAFNDDKPRLYDVFTYDKTEGINPFASLDYNFGERTSLYLYANGILEVHWALGGTHHGMNFYKISSDGFNIELVEGVSIKPKDYEDGYYHDENGETEISKMEFDTILQSYRDAGEIELNWVKMDK